MSKPGPGLDEGAIMGQLRRQSPNCYIRIDLAGILRYELMGREAPISRARIQSALRLSRAYVKVA